MGYALFCILLLSFLPMQKQSITSKLVNVTGLSLVDQLSFFFLPTFIFEKPSCLDILPGTRLTTLRDPYLVHQGNTKAFIELHAGNYTGHSRLCFDGRLTNKINYSCSVVDREFCDGYSSCPFDECGCGVDAFKCADGLGCVAMGQVCDTRPDCLDASDECICSSYQSCEHQVLFKLGSGISHYPLFDTYPCFQKPHCTFSVTETKTKIYNLASDLLLDNNTMDSETFPINRTKVLDCALSEKCLLNHHSKNLLSDPLKSNSHNSYHCKNKKFIMYNFRVDKSFFGFCDGVDNCVDGTDEKLCPYTFYCESDDTPIPMSKKCDQIPDCQDYSDECDNCSSSSYLASQTDLIGNKYIMFFIIILAILTVSLNPYALYFHCKRQESSSAVKIDKICCMSLAIFDLLMGVYLIIIIGMHFYYMGRYCAFNQVWRSSTLCKFAGGLHSGAPLGALQITLLTSLCRSYTCRNSLTDKKIPFKIFLGAFFFSMVTNVFMTVIPFVTATWLSPLSDVFVHDFYFPGNPILHHGNKSTLAKVVSLYSRIDRKVVDTFTLQDLFLMLENMTTKGELLSFSKANAFGYYGSTAMCNPDIFTEAPSMRPFKVLYAFGTSLCVLLISVSYIQILVEFKSVSSEVTPQHPAPIASTDKAFFLTVKVAVVITAQLICWLPVVVATIVSFFGVSITPIINEILIGIIIPINSAINPIMHTDILQRTVFRR